MQDLANGDTIPADLQPDYWLMISDLMSIIERIRTRLRIANEARSYEDAGNIVVLDDTAPLPQPQTAALNDCSLLLREALQFLLEARSANSQPVQADRPANRPPCSLQAAAS
jgi:hypothetical protein